jgi:hypothetical protein
MGGWSDVGAIFWLYMRVPPHCAVCLLLSLWQAFVEDIVTTFLPADKNPLSKWSLIIYHGTLFVLMLIGVAGAGWFAKINTALFVFLMLAIMMTFGSLLFM